MERRFDPAKDEINRRRHGLSLLFGDRIMEDPHYLVIPSIRPQDGEERFKAIGAVEGKLFTAVFTWRGDQPRFISVRRGNKGEEAAFRSTG
jgi:uncharacterized protein